MLTVTKSTLLRRVLIALACLTLLCAAAMTAAAEEVSDENLFNRRDPYFMEGYNYIQSTDQITVEPESFITGYIPVQAGHVVRLNLNSTQNSDFVKYALYNSSRVWQDTIKYNDVSELTIRIFEDGFIRVSVYGLDFERTITIFTSADRPDMTAAGQDTLLMSSNNTNIVVKTADEDESAYWTDRFDRTDPDYMDGYNFDQTSEKVVEEPNSFITGYIPVTKGDVILLNLNSDRRAAFVKYAAYDKNKGWLQTVKTNFVSELTFTASDTGFVRLSVYGRIFKSSATVYIHPALRLSADQQLEETVIPMVTDAKGQQDVFNATYLSNEVIELFNPNDPEFLLNQGFQQLTETIVPDEGSFLTGYIPVVRGQVVVVTINAASAFAKYAMFDADKNWLGTTRVDNPTVLVIPITDTGYFRFHGYGRALNNTTIQIPTVTKLDISAVSGNIDGRLSRLESVMPNSRQLDVVIFMGQSNMAGRGIVTDEHPEDAPAVIEGAGWEFRAVTDPTRLYEITKTFGLDENVTDAINDGSNKTGGLVPSLVNAYYTHNGYVPIVAISASEGNTSISDWQAGSPRLDDAISRLHTAVAWLHANGYEIRHQFMVWCQGEGDTMQTRDWYVENFDSMLAEMKTAGVEKCFLIRIGNSNPGSQNSILMMSYQNYICQTHRDVVLVANTFSTMLDRGLMKDNEHYFQQGYNECGEDAGVNMAYYVSTGKEPMMYDQQFDFMYYSKVN